jgi:hypothetical protein
MRIKERVKEVWTVFWPCLIVIALWLIAVLLVKAITLGFAREPSTAIVLVFGSLVLAATYCVDRRA